YADSVIAPGQPDLLLVSYGHNAGAETVRFRWGVQSLVETVGLLSPRTEIMLIAQNPQTGNSYQQARAAELADLASNEHVGFINVLAAFEATGNPADYEKSDGIHPNFGGSQLWAGTVLAGLQAAAAAPDPPEPADNIPSRPVSLIRYGDF